DREGQVRGVGGGGHAARAVVVAVQRRRDDATHLPFSVEGRHILLIDDVLYTGRTIRAVINELFDFGRPASVTLAVLVDRGGRELPVEPALSAARITLPATERVSLVRADDGRFQFHFERVE
ncbi:MAG: hypothetical protein EOP38_08760, partial [Rubrivivax sp.]